MFHTSTSIALLAVCVGSVAAGDGYSPPASYYAGVVYDGTPESLRNSLNSIIRGHTVRSYNAARQALAITDADPDNPSNVLLVYNGASVSGVWDSGITWNREHTWPRSRGVGDNGPDYSDLHALRACNPGVNSSRGNKPFGLTNSSFWDPTMAVSAIDYRGDMARSMFYMDVRYDGTEAGTVDLRVVNGFPGTNQMGDLSYLLEWHYEEAPSSWERRRNHIIYSFEDNPAYAQGNRNPFIDHPEYAWALWGSEPNNSQITLAGAAVGSDGGSELLFDVGRFILSGSVDDTPSFEVLLNKIGSTPTSYLVEASGDAFSSNHGIPGTFSRNNQQTALDVVLWAAAPGILSGQLVVTNTDLTSAGPGLGSADAPDIVNLVGEGVGASLASFQLSPVQTEITFDLGTIERSLDPELLAAPVFNAGGLPGTTASLILTDLSGLGDLGTISIPELPLAPIEGGGFAFVDIVIELGGMIGEYEAVYTIETADEQIPGAVAGETLTVTVSFSLIQSSCSADLSGNGAIDLADLNIVLANFGTQSGATLATGDASGDGAVGLADLNIVLAGFGSSCP